MPRLTGGDLRAFEGLVRTTAHMFAAQVRREEEDLAQELRVRVWRATATYDCDKSALSLERYVFQAVTNKIKDFKRDAAREARRRETYGLTFLYIEDMQTEYNGEVGRPMQEVFDGYYHFVSRDEVYSRVDDGSFVLPATVTQREADVVVLLMLGMGKPDVALRLALGRSEVDACVYALRDKFADWRPPGGSQTVQLTQVAA